ncbi:MAG: hypothetical protein KatS3mg131_0035 [Candidatus Tectimicrobiota bacterium]|nr:MAG: hypothetical protein KatS3mg131_0035 [Candidatus Tectomicrobia bacterium]
MSPEPFLLGTGGWAYRQWVGSLYPPELAPADYLAYYARHFDTVEVASTFFSVPARHTVRAWYARTPAHFVFSPRLPRRISHELRLRHAERELEAFLAVISELAEKLGPVLVQLPADLRRSEQPQLEAFLQRLPSQPPFAIEFRHGSWLHESTFQLLEAHGVAWVVVDAPFLPRVPRVTAPFAYVRWHGRPGARAARQLDPAAALRPWVPMLQALARQAGRVFGYVQNSFSGNAPRDCLLLRQLLGEEVKVRGGPPASGPA